MSKQSLKTTIDANIKQNGVQAITGQIMNSVLNQMVDGLADQTETSEKLTELKDKVDALALGAFYGYFPDSDSLPTDVTTPGYAYVGTDNPYEIWNFNGESWSDSGTSIDQNDADEEDITRNSDGKLQFKDRDTSDGMGYVILRKDKSFAEQVTEENTIYEIRYDFVLNGAEIEIPSNCVLSFVGGSLSNGLLVGLNTSINADAVTIFDNIAFRGIWLVKSAFVQWFGVKGNEEDETTLFSYALTSVADMHTELFIPTDMTILVNNVTIQSKSNFSINGQGVIKRYEEITTSGIYAMLVFRDCDKVMIPIIHTDGSAFSYYTEGENLPSSKEGAASIELRHCKNINIRYFYDTNPLGDSLYISSCNNVTCVYQESIGEQNCGRNALSIIAGSNIIFDYILSKKIGCPNMPGGIDIEPNSSIEANTNIIIRDSYVVTNGTSGISVSNYNNSKCDNIIINGRIEKTANRGYAFSVSNVNHLQSNIIIDNEDYYGAGALLAGYIYYSDIRLDIKKSTLGMLVAASFDATNVSIKVRDVTQEGIKMNLPSSTKMAYFDVDIMDSNASYVAVNSGSLGKNLVFRGNLAKGTKGFAGFRFEGILDNILIDGVNLEGWGDYYKIYGLTADYDKIVVRNCPGYNYSDSIPLGILPKNTIIYALSPVAGGYIGKICVQGGKTSSTRIVKNFGQITE